MPTLGSNTAEFSAIANSTTAAYVAGRQNNMLRDHPLLDLLRSKGKIIKQNGGDSRIWSSKHKQKPLQTMADLTAVTFQRTNRNVQHQLPPRGLFLSDAISWWSKQINTGKPALINLVSSMVEDLMEDFEDQFPAKLWASGNASGSQEIHGIDSFTSTSGALAGNDKVGQCDAEYAGQSCAQGVKAQWDSTNWPEGTGKPGYAYNSPLVQDVNVSYSGATNNWAGNCLRAMKYATLRQANRNKALDCWFLTTSAYETASNLLETREQIRHERGKSAEPMFEGGLGPAFKYENVLVKTGYGIPESGTDTRGAYTTYGYGVRASGKDDMEIRHWSPSLIYKFPWDFSIETMSDRLLLVSMCNLFCKPSAQVKLAGW